MGYLPAPASVSSHGIFDKWATFGTMPGTADTTFVGYLEVGRQ
jgi:hypothetical protein